MCLYVSMYACVCMYLCMHVSIHNRLVCSKDFSEKTIPGNRINTFKNKWGQNLSYVLLKT